MGRDQWVPMGFPMGIPMGCLWDSQLGTFGAPWGRGIPIGFPWGSLWCSEGPPRGFLRASRGDTRGERCSPPPPNFVWIICWILCICLTNTNCSVCAGIYTYCVCVAGWTSGTYIDVLAAPTPEFCMEDRMDLVYVFEEYKLFWSLPEYIITVGVWWAGHI